jgi:biopolymer transport protein ExbD
MAVKLKKGTVTQQLPVTPMVDLVFNLLLFFVVATKFAEPERQMPVLLPETSAAEERPVTEKTKELVITINQQGQYYVGDVKFTRDQLYPYLRTEWLQHSRHVSASIRADKHCQWAAVVAAMDMCKKAEIRKYVVETLDAPKGAK